MVSPPYLSSGSNIDIDPLTMALLAASVYQVLWQNNEVMT